MDIDLAPIQRFMIRVAKMAQVKQGDIRLSLAEAAELSACLAALLAALTRIGPATPGPISARPADPGAAAPGPATGEIRVKGATTAIDGGTLKS
jgi:hypothetical protein